MIDPKMNYSFSFQTLLFIPKMTYKWSYHIVSNKNISRVLVNMDSIEHRIADDV